MSLHLIAYIMRFDLTEENKTSTMTILFTSYTGQIKIEKKTTIKMEIQNKLFMSAYFVSLTRPHIHILMHT